MGGSGNDLAIIINGSSGQRSALTASTGEDAPELVIEYNVGQNFSRSIADESDDAEESGLGKFYYDVEMTKEAFARGCEKVWAAAWTPPANLKTNNDLQRGGKLRPQNFQAFADHLESYRSMHDAQSGIALYAISPQNEPGFKQWESCNWDISRFVEFFRDFAGPTINTRIVAPEATAWFDEVDVDPSEHHRDDVEHWYQPIHDDLNARAQVDIIAGHAYNGNESDISVSLNHYGKPVWLTEWSYDTTPENLSIDNGLEWAENWWTLLTEAKVASVHYWWAVNFESGDQEGLINATRGVPGYTIPKRTWTFGNYSKFIRPDFVQIASDSNPAENVFVSCFKRGDDFVFVVVNRNNSAEDLTFNFDGFSANSVTPHRTSASEDLVELPSISTSGGNSFVASLAAKSVTTYVGTAADSALSIWRYENFGTYDDTGDAADSADFDKDGIKNLMEYALGTVPTDRNTPSQEILDEVEVAGKTYLSLKVNRVEAKADIDYIFESGDNLSDWDEEAVTLITNSATEIEARDNVAIADSDRRFLRLRVEPLNQ